MHAWNARAEGGLSGRQAAGLPVGWRAVVRPRRVLPPGPAARAGGAAGALTREARAPDLLVAHTVHPLLRVVNHLCAGSWVGWGGRHSTSTRRQGLPAAGGRRAGAAQALCVGRGLQPERAPKQMFSPSRSQSSHSTCGGQRAGRQAGMRRRGRRLAQGAPCRRRRCCRRLSTLRLSLTQQLLSVLTGNGDGLPPEPTRQPPHHQAAAVRAPSPTAPSHPPHPPHPTLTPSHPHQVIAALGLSLQVAAHPGLGVGLALDGGRLQQGRQGAVSSRATGRRGEAVGCTAAGAAWRGGHCRGQPPLPFVRLGGRTSKSAAGSVFSQDWNSGGKSMDSTWLRQRTRGADG